MNSPDSSNMDNLHHIALQVPDIGKAVAWYRDRFRIDCVYQDDSWAMLRFGNIDLALVLPGQHPPHIAIEHPDAASFGALKRHRDGTSSVYVNDPFGNVLEVMQASGPADAPAAA